MGLHPIEKLKNEIWNKRKRYVPASEIIRKRCGITHEREVSARQELAHDDFVESLNMDLEMDKEAARQRADELIAALEADGPTRAVLHGAAKALIYAKANDATQPQPASTEESEIPPRCCGDAHSRSGGGKPCNYPCECDQCVAHYNAGGHVPTKLKDKYPVQPAPTPEAAGEIASTPEAVARDIAEECYLRGSESSIVKAIQLYLERNKEQRKKEINAAITAAEQRVWETCAEIADRWSSSPTARDIARAIRAQKDKS